MADLHPDAAILYAITVRGKAGELDWNVLENVH